jgi:hypothetical protein
MSNETNGNTILIKFYNLLITLSIGNLLYFIRNVILAFSLISSLLMPFPLFFSVPIC